MIAFEQVVEVGMNDGPLKWLSFLGRLDCWKCKSYFKLDLFYHTLNDPSPKNRSISVQQHL